MASTMRVRARDLLDRTRDRVDDIPLVGRLVAEWRRVEVVDRAMVTAAQGLLALVPLVVVLVAFLPHDLTRTGLERFAEITGLADASVERAVDTTPRAITSVDDVRAQIGVVGALVTVLSASSFARAVMRAYERVWDVPHLAGFRGRRRALGWLLGWLVALEAISLVTRVLDRLSVPLLAVGALRLALVVGLWWWTLHVLLHGARSWRRLVLPALFSGVAVVSFMGASTVRMPAYSLDSVRQFGGLGLVLALATWLVAFSAVLVVSGIVGRVVAEGLERWVGNRTSPAPDETAPQHAPGRVSGP